MDPKDVFIHLNVNAFNRGVNPMDN